LAMKSRQSDLLTRNLKLSLVKVKILQKVLEGGGATFLPHTVDQGFQTLVSNISTDTRRQTADTQSQTDATENITTPRSRVVTRSSATAKSTARPSYLVDVLYDISREKICDG